MAEKDINFVKYYKYIPVFILFIILILWHLGFQFETDDVYFQSLLSNLPIISLDGNNFLVMRYFTWSSRSLIELNFSTLVSLPEMIWKILNSIIYCLIAIFMVELSFKDKKLISPENEMIFYSLSCLFISIFFLTFKNILESAGWVATTTNYVWPFFFALLHFYILKNYTLNNEKRYEEPLIINVISLIALLEAISSEQLIVVVSFVYLIITAYLIIKKIKLSKIFVPWILIALNYIYIFLCPGNGKRFEVAVNKLCPYWYNLTLVNKVDFGFNVFLNWCITQVDIITMLFFAIFAIYSIIHLKKKKISIISCIPLFITIIFLILQLSGYGSITDALHLAGGGTIFSMDMNLKTNIILINLIVAISMLLSIYFMFKQDKKNFAVLSLLILIVLCIMSAAVSGFSPLFSSMGRPFLFSYLILVLSNLMMVIDIFRVVTDKK